MRFLIFINNIWGLTIVESEILKLKNIASNYYNPINETVFFFHLTSIENWKVKLKIENQNIFW